MELFVVGSICFGFFVLIWFINGLTTNRLRDLEKELDEFSGVYDVKRSVKDKLNSDNEYKQRVRDTFNDESD